MALSTRLSALTTDLVIVAFGVLMRRQLLPALTMLLVFTAGTSTAAAPASAIVLAGRQANGALLERTAERRLAHIG